MRTALTSTLREPPVIAPRLDWPVQRMTSC